MRVTTWAEYGVICALHLARRPGEARVTGREIAAREDLPGDYVEQILLRLRRADIIASTRGAHGGYALSRPAREITLREIIAAAELGTFHVPCATHRLEGERCAEGGDCSVRPVWHLLQRRIDEVLEGVLLSDLLAEEEVVRQRIGLPVLQS